MDEAPIRWHLRLLRLFCKESYLEEIEGDLIEHYEKRVEERKPAVLLLWIEIFKLIRPRIMKSIIDSKRPYFMHYILAKHHLKLSFRLLNANRTTSIINIVGLTVGIASSFLLFKYIGFFYTIDSFQEKKDRIYAIHQTLASDENTSKYSKSTYNGVAPMMKEQYPEVEATSRYITTAETLVRVTMPDGNMVKYNENSISEVDPDFLKMFTINFLEGNPQHALTEPNTMALSSTMAKKYFGERDPIGQIITTTKSWGEKRDWIVTGVFEDYPANSYFRFNALQSLVGKEFEVGLQDWQYPFFKSFVLMDDPFLHEGVAEKMTSYVNDLQAFQSRGNHIDFHLIAFTERTLSENQKLLIVITIFLMLITWINYTNLSATNALNRGKEFGVRKVLGSSKTSFTLQFIIETTTVYLLAGLVAMGLVLIIHPLLDRTTNGQLLSIFEFDSSINFLFLGALLLGSSISGILPSSVISSVSIMNLVKNKMGSKTLSGGFRKSLVSLQLIIALVMLTGVITIYMQMQYVRSKDLGIDTHQTLILKGPKDEWDGKLARMSAFKKEVQRLPSLTTVSSSTTVPLWWVGAPTIFKLQGSVEDHRMFLIGTDGEYFDGYDIDLVAGEYYKTRQYNKDKQLVVINETAARKLGFSDPFEALNKKITNSKTNAELEIIGVVKDYHHQSFKEQIKAQVFDLNPFRGFISLHLDLPDNTSESSLTSTIDAIEEVWSQVYANQAFDYYFLDERANSIYEEEQFFQKMFVWFTSISVVVTFLGIFGLSMFISIQRRKEMGIRKAMGAKPIEVLQLFYTEFSKNVAIAFIVGTPIAYYLMELWLSDFSYRVSFSFWMFIVPGLLLSLFMILSLSYEGNKMANINPVSVLRDE